MTEALSAGQRRVGEVSAECSIRSSTYRALRPYTQTHRTMNRAPFRIALVLLLAGWLGQAVAQAPVAARLTLADAVRLAEFRSQALVAADAQLQSARQLAFGAGELPDASLRLGITNLPINGNDRFSLSRDFMTMRSIGVMQD